MSVILISVADVSRTFLLFKFTIYPRIKKKLLKYVLHKIINI